MKALMDRLRPVLSRQLRKAFPRASDGLIIDATEDALVQYALGPTDFEPTANRSLNRAIYQAAWRNTADALDATTRRRAREAHYARWIALANRPSRAFGEHNWNASVRAERQVLTAAVNEAERNALRQWLDGERRTGPLAAALGISQLWTLEQQRDVKRFKDRLLKRLERLRSKPMDLGSSPPNQKKKLKG